MKKHFQSYFFRVWTKLLFGSIIKGITGYEIIRLICMHLQSNNLLFSNIMYTVSIKVGINDHNPASAIHAWYIYCLT